MPGLLQSQSHIWTRHSGWKWLQVVLYEVPALRSMMPTIKGFVGNEAHDARSLSGYEWPPCIIIERGESLQEWAQREQHDFVTILQVPPLHACISCRTLARSCIHFINAVDGLYSDSMLLPAVGKHAPCSNIKAARGGYRCCTTWQRGWQHCTAVGGCTVT